MPDLFGKNVIKVASDFPSSLQALVKASHWSAWRTVDELIDNHTLLPFHAPFISARKITQLRAAMVGAQGGMIHARLGILTHPLKLINFRYCAKCTESDRSIFGETYWHRIHQLPGIDICPVHKVFLSESAVHTRRRSNRQAFVTAESAIISLVCTELNLADRDHAAYVKLADDAKWLLETRLPTDVNNGNQERYLSLLYDLGLAGYDGPVRLKVLIEQLRTHYSEQLLDRFHCALHRKHNWVTRLIHGMIRSQHPIEHLLLIQFLGLTAADFFNTETGRLPFGEGPWPCLNPTCHQFRTPAITDYEESQTPLNYLSKEPKKAGHPIAKFSCNCGFAYYRIGPDQEPSDRYLATGFLSVTRPWIQSFRAAFREQPLPVILAKRFCTNTEAALLMLKELDLVPSFPRKKQVSIADESRELTTKDRFKRKLRRKRWLQVLAANKEISRNKLCRAHPAHFQWFVAHDKQWFYHHLPPRKTSHGPGFRTNWADEDQILSREVLREAKRIRALPGKPIRVSPTLIATNLGRLAVVTKRGHLLPHTLQALADSGETIEQFVIRRINYETEHLREQGRRVARWKLQLLSGVSNEAARRPQIRETLTSCADSLQETVV